MGFVISMLKTFLTPELYCSNIQYQRKEERFAMVERQGSCIMLEEIRHDKERVWLNAPLEKPFGRGINFEIKTNKIDMLYARVQNASGPSSVDRTGWLRAGSSIGPEPGPARRRAQPGPKPSASVVVSNVA